MDQSILHFGYYQVFDEQQFNKRSLWMSQEQSPRDSTARQYEAVSDITHGQKHESIQGP